MTFGSLYLSSLLIQCILLAAPVSAFFTAGNKISWYPPKPIRATRSIAKQSTGIFDALTNAKVVDPRTGKECPAIDSALFNAAFNPLWPKWKSNTGTKALVVVMPQLGDFDTVEYANYLKEILPDLKSANIALRIIGIGNCKTAQMFSLFTGIPLECIRVDPTATVHSTLDLHRGPDWDLPDWVPAPLIDWFAAGICGNDNDKIPAEQVARSWFNYMAMCAGIAAPGTLREILRGYLGDRSAPEILTGEETVYAGPVTIKGTSDVKIGPIKYKNFWANEEGYLRPVELATVRLRSMVEVLTKFVDYVPDQRLLDWRGATFLIDETCSSGNQLPLYEYRNPGVLTYSETMPRPLSFLGTFIGMDRARNPLGLKDPDYQYEY